MKSQRRWILWKHLDGRKPPVDRSGVPLAKWNDPANWLTWDEANRARAHPDVDGIGFVLGDGWSGIDLDDCRDPDTGRLDPRAQAILEACPGAHSEVSPSRKGLKVFGHGGPWLEINFHDPARLNIASRPSGYFTVMEAPPDGALPDLPLDAVARLGEVSQTPVDAPPKTRAALPSGGLPIPPGDQDRWLHSRAGKYRRDGATFEEIVEHLLVDFQRCPPAGAPWTRADAERHARQVCRHDPADESHLISLGDPLNTGRKFVSVYAEDALRYQGEVFYQRSEPDNAWLSLEEAEIRGALWSYLESCQSKKQDSKGNWTTEPVRPKAKQVSEILDAVKGLTVLSRTKAAPCWLDGRASEPLLAFRNGLLRLSDRTLLPPDPAYYNHIALPFDYAPEARLAADSSWGRFLDSLWPDDPASQQLLQEMMGYVLAGDTSMQKILMMVGPKRGGKGTIARVLRNLVGQRNACGPTLASIGETFGRETLIGKTIAIVSDARLSRKSDTAVVVEELLAISGEDARSIQRKYLAAWEGPLPVRFLLLTNELPRIEDASGALASRFVILRLTQSFYGHEDLGLFGRLLTELPGILNWSLDGYDRLRKAQHFTVPESARQIAEEFEALGSPIGAFLRENADVGPRLTAHRDEVWGRWKQWCDETGRMYSGTKETLGRDLRAAIPGLAEKRIKDGDGRSRVWVGLSMRPIERDPGSDEVPF